MAGQVVSVKRPRSGLFAGMRSLPFWLRALWPAAGSPSQDERAEAASARDDVPAFDGSLCPAPRWPRLRAEAARDLDCERCGRCVAACPSRALETIGSTLVLDLGRCIGCGICVERCPEAALALGEGMPVFVAPPTESGLRMPLGSRGTR